MDGWIFVVDTPTQLTSLHQHHLQHKNTKKLANHVHYRNRYCEHAVFTCINCIGCEIRRNLQRGLLAGVCVEASSAVATWKMNAAKKIIMFFCFLTAVVQLYFRKYSHTRPCLKPLDNITKVQLPHGCLVIGSFLFKKKKNVLSTGGAWSLDWKWISRILFPPFKTRMALPNATQLLPLLAKITTWIMTLNIGNNYIPLAG